MTYKSTIINFKSKSKKTKTKGAYFSGKIYIKNDQNSMIHDYYIIFDKVGIDIMTTDSWFEKKTPSFRIREKVFEYVGLEKQEKRNGIRTNHKIRELSEEELLKFNESMNSIAKNKTTVKNFIGIIKGSNPSGEIKNPKSAQMIIGDEDSKYRNFLPVLDKLIEIEVEKDAKEEKIDMQTIKEAIDIWSNFENQDINSFFNNNSLLKSIINKIQKGSSEKEKKEIYKNLDSLLDKYNQKNKWIKNKIVENRSLYAKNINAKSAFDNNKKADIEENAHIYAVKWIKKEIMKIMMKVKDDKTSWENNKEIKNQLKKVSDPYNYLNLAPTEHARFDKLHFTYLEDGRISILNGSLNILEIKEKYHRINPNYLTEKTKKYIQERNNFLNIDINFIS